MKPLAAVRGLVGISAKESLEERLNGQKARAAETTAAAAALRARADELRAARRTALGNGEDVAPIEAELADIARQTDLLDERGEDLAAVISETEAAIVARDLARDKAVLDERLAHSRAVGEEAARKLRPALATVAAEASRIEAAVREEARAIYLLGVKGLPAPKRAVPRIRSVADSVDEDALRALFPWFRSDDATGFRRVFNDPRDPATALGVLRLSAKVPDFEEE